MKYFFLISFALCSVSLGAQVIDTLILKEQHTALFASDAWELSSEELIALDSILSLANDSDTIFLEGHTDKVGSEKYNQLLSAERVKTIKEELVRLGIGEEKMTTKAYGELNPVERGSNESAFKYNRRVTIHFLKLVKRRKITGQVEEEETKKPLLAKIKIEGKSFSDSTITTIGGKFSFKVPDNGVYKLEITSDNHFFEQRFIKVSSKDSSDISIGLPEVKIGSIYTLPNFNFKGNLPVLLKRSVPTLELLYELMDKSEFCIEIKGHINLPNLPDCELDTRHYKLSVDRAEMVFEHMGSRGIASGRMLPKGYGNWEMLYPKAAIEKDMSKNRRVEIKIIDCKSDKLISKNKK
jgi:outer membrane protein OmpA-like peptidoglycan-associated protein